MRKVLALFACCALVSSAAAQVSIPTGPSARASAPTRGREDADSVESPAPAGHKSAALAVGLSVVVTGVPIFLATRSHAFGTAQVFMAGLGLIAGPAAGYLYAGVDGASRGALFRTEVLAGTAGVLVGGYLLCASGSLSGGSPAVCYLAAVAGFVGVGIVAGSAIYDIVRLPGAMRAGEAAEARVAVLPLVDPGAHSAGAAVQVTF